MEENYFVRHLFQETSCRYPTGGRFPERVYSNLNGHATEITDGAGRRTEISWKIETSVEENFWP